MFRNGDSVYFYSASLGITIPATVKDTKLDRYLGPRLLISGNFPKGDQTVWVNESNCEIQTP